MWTSFSIALRILTSVPVSTLGSPAPTVVRRSVMLFPIVGALVGVVCGGVWTIASALWPHELLVAAGAAMLTELLLTGGRGLSGAARAADALLSFHDDGDRGRAIALLRDSRRNTGGIVGAIILAILKTGFLASLHPQNGFLSLIVAMCLGQWAVAFSFTLFRLLPAWNNPDIEGSFAGAGMNEFIGAIAFAVFGAAIIPIRGLIALAAIAVVVGPIARSIARTFDGLNVYFGYGLGYVAEIVALGVLAANLGSVVR